jgi:tight adherence protein B
VKRLSLLAALLLAVPLLAGTSRAAGTSASARLIKSTFPVRTVVVSLPSNRHLTTRDIRVTENGQAVLDPTLVPASGAAKKTFGVVLVLDTSDSMQGGPIAAAVKAEHAFIAKRNRNEQLGVVEFNRQARVVLPLTTSGLKIGAFLASTPSLAPGTHIFDAVARAEAMLSAAHIRSGSIVVLSDGADTGSRNRLPHVAHAAVAANMRIYTIGLDDKSYKPGTLTDLAAQGHGEYKEEKANALAPLFDQLSRQLSNEYLLRYKSLLGPKVHVHVQVQVKGLGSAFTSYRTPPLPSQGAATPSKPSTSGIWTSEITVIVLGLIVAAIIAFVVIGLLAPRRTGLPARMAEFVSIRGLQRDKGDAATAGQSDAEQPKDLWTRFEEILEIADIKTPPEMIVAGTFAVTALAFLLIYVVTSSPWWSLLALVVPYLSREWVVRTLRRRRNRFAEQLPDALQVIGSALRSGHSFAGALAVVVEGGSEPLKSEMQQVVADEQLGVPIQDSLQVVAERMASRDLEQLALVAQLQREAGGDAAEVVDRVAETVRERFDLKRLIQTLTMQGRMSRWIVSALPIVVVLAVYLENPHYFHPLTSALLGRIALGFAAAWAVAGSFVIKRIVEIEV